MAPPVFDISELIAWIMISHCEWCFQKSQDHEDPQLHAISERGLAIQSYLRIPPQIGFFSSESGRMRALEGFLFVYVVIWTTFIYLVLGVSTIWVIWVGEDIEEFLQMVASIAWFLPTVLTVTVWILLLFARFLDRRRRDRTPLKDVKEELISPSP
ncbi:hypothetical protein CSOJ01_09233 [Colletotrichum sojae]|uniref:Uncharacterized protein n=1 Tax=Colletotrichum sojae TaxID=2175907 RepID=A0A8H6MR22_9PEZI|nr:hypothetical protein CSOJ01_09233 [Colletotrichum sojae]